MNPYVQAALILEFLLANWAAVRVRGGPELQSREQDLVALASRIRAAEPSDHEEIADTLDDLIALLQQTPAHEYVDELLARCDLRETRLHDRYGIPVLNLQEIEDAAYRTAMTLAAEIAKTTVIRQVPIVFATNRAQSNEGFFSGALSEDVTIGRALTSVPIERHRVGHLERPGLFAGEDDSKHIVLHGVDVFEDGQPHRLDESIEGRAVVLFIHGFGVKFEEAALRACQFAMDLGGTATVVLFSWPAGGKLRDYNKDGEDAHTSRFALADFASKLLRKASALHVLAHSMGSRVAVGGLNHLRWSCSSTNGELVLLAADLSVSEFVATQPSLNALCRGVTSYASHADLALRVSRRLNKHERVGLFKKEPFVTKDLETIDASRFSTGILGHGYYASAEEVLSDLRLLMHDDKAPDDRGLTRRPMRNYWEFP